MNSGKFTGGKNLDDTIVRTNVEAATEVARQVRLRDIGGIIVCDFIDMSSEGDRNRVITALQEGLRKDRTRSTIQSFSPLGLLEFTRKRVGKDLGQQLRGKCPTCEGLGSVMSPESVTIGAFREILGHKNGEAKHVHIAAAPSVAAQAEYWYEDERVQLAERVGAHIDVFVDPAVHPERPRIIWGDDKLPTLGPIRVGDEFEVELLTQRLPNPTSAAAIVAGRLIEVENAANAAGKIIKIRILDVDGSDILAEPRSPIEAATAIGEARSGKKRRRGGRGRKRELTAAEQADELRELAEEAEKGLGGRSAIGISTTEEVVAKKAGPKTTAQKAAEGGVALLAGESLSGSRPAASAPSTASAASAGHPVVLPGEKLSGSRVSGASRPPTPIRPLTTPATAATPAPAGSGAEHDPHEGPGRKRRRRRRGGRSGAGDVAAHAAAPVAAGAASAEPADLEDDDEDAAVDGQTQSGGVGESGDRKRRRRRRRRRGGRGAAGDGQAVAADGQQPAVPDRHIFRVDPEGAAHATGETAPPVPSRALAPWNRKRGDVAVEPPPPVITAPPERGETVKTTRPARRRRTGAQEEAPRRGGRLEAGTPVRALPAPEREPAAAPAEAVAVPKRTTRARKTADPAATAASAAEAPAPKGTSRARKTSAPAAAKAKKSAPAAATAKKAPARKAAAKKAPAAKPAASAKKSSSATRKAPPAKKATTARKKR